MDGLTRRTLLKAAAAAAMTPALDGMLSAAPARAQAPGTAWDRAAYLAYADAVVGLLYNHWHPELGFYNTPDAGQSMTNANLLLVHAVAAQYGHTGASRQDERARLLAARLCASPPWGRGVRLRSGPLATIADEKGIVHDNGWQSLMNRRSPQHPVIDAAVVRGLAAAHDARAELGLPPETVAVIENRIRRCAYSAFYRYPQIRLNQINWPLEIYAHAANVLGDGRLLRRDGALQLRRFASRLRRDPPGRALPNLGPSYRFHYQPDHDERSPSNLDSAEYANLVIGALAWYDQALAAGMEPLPPQSVALLRAWVERVVGGYWTHAGYLNWDTGLGFLRWHQSKKLPLAQEGLLAIASSPRFRTPVYGAWAKWLYDRGLEWYGRQIADALARGRRELPPEATFGVWSGTGPGDNHLTAGRMAANAVRAIQRGLDVLPSAAPPPLYAYDPDVGRLAVTTPTYNTAILLEGRGVVPYAGADPARLFDGDQHVVAGTGGARDATFGCAVIDHSRRSVLRSHSSRRGGSMHDPGLRLVEAPRGSQRPLPGYPAHAFAGPFEALDAIASTRGRTATIVSRHRFAPESIESVWTVLPRPGRHAPHTVRVTFPSWGSGARITAILLAGGERVVGSAALDLAEVAWFHVAGADRGYVIRPLHGSGPVRLLHPAPQASQPRPGPTLAIDVLRLRPLRRVRARFRYAPAIDRADAERVAAALLAR